MNKVWVYFAKIALGLAIKELSKLDDVTLQDLTDKLNAKLDAPRVPEEVERKIIYKSLSLIVVAARELLGLIKL